MSTATKERIAVDDDASVEPVSEDEALRQEAISSLKRRRRFTENAVAYVTVNGILWLIWALSDRSVDGGVAWPAWVTVIWGFVLALDAWKTFGSWPRSLRRPISEADVARELERQRRGSTRRSRSTPMA
jgi:hypothetical protein